MIVRSKISTEMVLPPGKIVMMVMLLSLHQNLVAVRTVLLYLARPILDDGYSTGDGTYWIDPDGTGAFEVYCDMTTDGGG